MNRNLNIKSKSIGVFTYNDFNNSYEQNDGEIHWTLKITNESANVNAILKKAEQLFKCIDEFDKKAKEAIAEELIDYKNDFWPEYDESDKNLDWDSVDAGEYNVTSDKFVKAITLYDIEIGENDIFCEYNDGDLFGGHRIHACFNNDYQLLSAEV